MVSVLTVAVQHREAPTRLRMDSVDVEASDTSIGHAVVKARDEIKQLRDRLLVKRSEGRIDIGAVEDAFLKTEETLKRRTEEILSEINNRVQSLPFSAVQAATIPHDGRKQQFGVGDFHEEEAQTYHLTTVVPLFNDDHGENAKMRKKLMGDSQPERLPQITSRAPNKQPPERHVRTVDTLSPLPIKHHREPEVVMSDSETQGSLAHLFERGLVPRATQIVLDPHPIQHRTAALHDRNEPAPAIPAIEYTPEKLDRLEKQKAKVQIQPINHKKEKRRFLKRNKSEKDLSSARPYPPPATPATMISERKVFQFTIHHGRIREFAPDFQSFRHYHNAEWDGIAAILGHLVKLLVDYSIPLAQVDGNAVVFLSEEYSEHGKPSRQQLLSCLINRQDIEEFMLIPGRRYVAPDGRVAAAVKLQACWRGYLVRSAYMRYLRRKWAVGVISLSWILYSRIAKVRRTLHNKRLKQLDVLRSRNLQLAEGWKRIKNESRVIIHMPSLGYPKQIRKSGDSLQVYESTQFGRLFELADSNTDVIYLSSSPVSDDLMHYYSKMVSLRKAVLTGDQSQTQSMDERFKIIVPDWSKSFQPWNMPLSSLLKYSPRTLKRIRNIIRGRTAYIVPALPTQDDVYVADVLGVAMLSAEPEVAQLYSTKSGAKRVLEAAKVSTSPCVFDIYRVQQLHESLAQLITSNILTIKKYLFKMDHEHHSRGLALVDVATNLPCYSWAWREADRFGDNWSEPRAQEPVLDKVLEQVPLMLDRYAQVLHKEAYPSWSKYLEQFLASGGIIEAVAPSQSATCFTVDCLIEPDGNVSVLCSGDHIHQRDDLFYQAAVSIPQCSVEAQSVNEACLRIGEACKQRKIVGYFCVDFVTFVDARSNEQVVWATDLKLQYSEQLANFQLVKFLTNGEFVSDSHELTVMTARKPGQSQLTPTPPSRESSALNSSTRSNKSIKERKIKLGDTRVRSNQRFAVASSRLFHANMSVIQYSVFFQMCRANGIGFDIKEKEGSLFLLRDPTKREHSAMVAVSEKLGDALSLFAKNLNVLSQEATSGNSTGKSNYKTIIDEIDSIMKLLGLNISDEKNRLKSNSSAE